jgi:hypothetical protein
MPSSSARYATMAAMAVLMLGLGWVTSAAWGQGDTGPVAPGGPDLQTTLQTGLKARRPEEFAFISQVVDMVGDGTLPRSVVITSFLWARRHKPYPFPYFEFGLQAQAAQLGVNIDLIEQQGP